ncbi:unnamed protein product [Rotaria sordida]|uniref:Uncharacterized protein n=1 Tax=Rotaria sordida TaxID=392033 RepID=A0A815WP62_9BILA|nr:unnamed protein product [Rotaria sordida]CAF1673028.1 unnamed protein product [Rotaria sordida]
MWIPQDEHLLATILHPQLKHFGKNPSDKIRAIKNLNILKVIFDNQMGNNEQNQGKRKNDQSSNKSSDENIKKQKVDENDDILIEEKENMF